MTKMKQVTYASLPYMSKLAACMYPDKVPEHIQQEMLKISDGWGRRTSLQRRIDKGNADAGRAKPTVPDDYYSRVPGLRRK
jgi:hypothetical protein